MTNHWVDLKNANVLLIMGSNAVENHPIASAHMWKAKDLNNATIIHVDPRFTRTSAKADIYAPIRSGTDIAFLGGMIRWAIKEWYASGKTKYINEQYVKDCTNGLLKIRTDFQTCRDAGHPGKFSGWGGSSYTTTTWDYQYGPDYVPYTTWAASTVYALNAVVVPTALNGYGYKCTVAGTSGATQPTWPTTPLPPGNTVVDNGVTWTCVFCPPLIKTPLKAASLDDVDCVFQKLREQYSMYTPEMVEKICGTPAALFEQICEAYCGGTYANDKAGVMLYAMGWTQHTVGTQNIRTASILQELLGNIGVAGGGVDALRGWHNVQGATDHGVLMHLLPGYLSAPQSRAADATLGIGPLDPVATYLKSYIATAMDPDAPTTPDSKYWWGMFNNQYNRARYMVSLLKAWWPTVDPQVSYHYIPKRNGDKSYLSLFNDMDAGSIKGLFAWGTNPMVMGPDQNLERPAMDKLEWMVCCDLFETETATFWKRPGVDPTLINTEVYFLPGASFAEKKGSASNSGRLMQWRDKACNPPKPSTDPTYPDSGAKDESDILDALGTAIKNLYASSVLPQDDGIKNLMWPYNPVLGSDLIDGIAKEENGYALQTFSPSGYPTVTYTAGQQIDNFFHLDATGKTACGNWLFCGTWQRTGNKMINRDPKDYHPAKIGIYHNWGYSWPVNRRIIYNRASVNQTTGLPLNPTKWVVWWNGTTWNGGCTGTFVNDVVDGFGTSGPQGTMPFIMNREGVSRIMGIGALADGPFPEHYEPWETPLNANPLTNGAGPLTDPVVFNYGKLYADTPAERLTYPIVCTTYRLTEHWHGGGFTRNCPTQCELMPEPFIEISEELAADKGISNGDNVLVTSARGSITVKACVTKRFKPFIIDGNEIHEVGLPWHWGWAGMCSGASANVLTPFIGDVSTRIPETKVFLVDIQLVP